MIWFVFVIMPVLCLSFRILESDVLLFLFRQLLWSVFVWSGDVQMAKHCLCHFSSGLSLFKTDILKIVLFFWMFHLLNVWPEMIWSPLFSRTFYFSGHHGDASILIEFELEENSQLSVIGVLCFKDCIIMGTLVPCGDLRVIQYLAFRESRISELRLSSSLNELWSLALTRTEESIQFLVLVFDESLCLFRGFSAQVYGRAICSREDWAVYVL